MTTMTTNTSTTTPGGADETGQTAPRGRPRSQKAHQAVLDAAAELLLDQGLSAVSMDTVAKRAGVSKATIYRWWPTKETLALDALYTEWDTTRTHPRDTGSLRGDLLALLRPWARRARTRPYARVIAALLTEVHTDPAFADEYRQRVVEPRREQARAVLRRAIERGEIPAETNIEVAVDLVYGPLYHRLLHGHAPLSDRFVNDVVDMALRGIQRPTDAPRRTDNPDDDSPDDHGETHRNVRASAAARRTEGPNH